jgi:hypothetical protein
MKTNVIIKKISGVDIELKTTPISFREYLDLSNKRNIYRNGIEYYYIAKNQFLEAKSSNRI